MRTAAVVAGLAAVAVLLVFGFTLHFTAARVAMFVAAAALALRLFWIRPHMKRRHGRHE